MNNKLLAIRLRNKYTIMTFWVVFAMGLVSWLMGSEILPVLWSYGPDVSCSYKEYVLRMWDQLLCWEMFIDSMMRYIIIIFPILVGFCVVGFVDELDSYHVLGAVRLRNRNRVLVKALLVRTIIGGVVTVLPIIILTVSVDYLMYPAITEKWGIGTLFPSDFYYQHPLVVYLAMLFIIYIPTACAYAGIALSVGIVTRNKVKMILIPQIIYIMLNYMNIFTHGKSMTSAVDLLVSYNTSSTFSDLMVELAVQIIIALICSGIALHIDKTRKLIVQ